MTNACVTMGVSTVTEDSSSTPAYTVIIHEPFNDGFVIDTYPKPAKVKITVAISSHLILKIED